MNILLTGGAGYLGSVLCEALLHKGHQVTVLDDLSAKGSARSLLHLVENPSLAFVRGDVRDASVLKPLLAKADAIFPLAAVVGAPACDRDPERARAVNMGAIDLLEQLRGAEQLVVYPTTNSGYGKRPGEVCTEETPLRPVSLYGLTKTYAEEQLLGGKHARSTITFRLATAFGVSPRPRFDLLVNFFVWRAVTDRYLVLFEPGVRRNFVHVRDVADAFLFALDRPEMAAKAYNVGLSDANLTKAELAARVKDHVPDLFVHAAAVGRDPDQRDYEVSNERLAKAGFQARRSLSMGISELLRAYTLLAGAPPA